MSLAVLSAAFEVGRPNNKLIDRPGSIGTSAHKYKRNGFAAELN